MRLTALVTAAFTAILFLAGCASKGPQYPPLTPEVDDVATMLDLDKDRVRELEAKQIYEFSEDDLDYYLRYVDEVEPNLPDRVVKIGRKNIGQPYEIYLLGEAPFEVYDPQPLYNLQKSDCVVFSEHTYAMALAHDWPSFFKILQRIRYKNGEISVVTRNHYTEVDWDRNNSWLIEDITEELAGADAMSYKMPVDRAKFLRKRYKLNVPIEKIIHREEFIPYDKIADIEGKLQNGDFVNVVRERNGGYWVGHTGLIAIADDGTVDFLHSTPPTVREQPIQEYIANHKARDAKNPDKAHLAGFKFLRLRQDPIANLKAIDGPNAPIITPPTQNYVKDWTAPEENEE